MTTNGRAETPARSLERYLTINSTLRFNPTSDPSPSLRPKCKRQGENPPLRQGFPAAPARPLPSFRARIASLVQPGRPSTPPSLTPLPPFNFGPPSRLIARGDQTRRDFIFNHPKRRT
jgi:hypothetical protein